MNQVYIAAPWQMKQYAAKLADALADLGYLITSTWFNSALVEDETDDAIARTDLRQIDACDTLIFINPHAWATKGTGGRHFETGYAYKSGKRIVLVGARTNCFHNLSEITVIEDTRIETLVEYFSRM